LLLSLCCSHNLIDYSSNILRGINNKMIARNFFPSRLHFVIHFPTGFRVILRHSCFFSGKKALLHHFGGSFNPDQDELCPGSFCSAVEILSMVLQQVCGIKNDRYSLPQKLFDENMASREKPLIFTFFILRIGEQDFSQSIAC